jgi:hypothetical protein
MQGCHYHRHCWRRQDPIIQVCESDATSLRITMSILMVSKLSQYSVRYVKVTMKCFCLKYSFWKTRKRGRLSENLGSTTTTDPAPDCRPDTPLQCPPEAPRMRKQGVQPRVQHQHDAGCAPTDIPLLLFRLCSASI